MESVQLTTDDGRVLDGDLAMPSDVPVGGVAICHPHPLYGGDRFHPIVDALFRTLPGVGLAALRFDFRRDDDGGRGAQLDLVAAVNHLAAVVAAPIAVAGYSFGGWVALATRHPTIGAVAAIAPPLGPMPPVTPSVPTLVLTPTHDQFSPPEITRAAISDWTDTTFEEIESADHFLTGHAAAVAQRVVEWLAGSTGAVTN